MHTHHTDAVQHVNGRGSRLTASGMHAHVPHDTPGVPRVVAAVRAALRGVGSRGVARRASSTHRASTRDTNVHRVKAVHLRCRRGLVSEVAEDMYVHGRGGAHQRGVHVGCKARPKKHLL